MSNVTFGIIKPDAVRAGKQGGGADRFEHFGRERQNLLVETHGVHWYEQENNG